MSTLSGGGTPGWRADWSTNGSSAGASSSRQSSSPRPRSGHSSGMRCSPRDPDWPELEDQESRFSMNARTIVAVVCGIAALGSTVSAQDLSRYRNFEAGSSLATVAATASVAASEAKTLYRRPAVIQDLEWRPSHWTGASSAPSNDPVEQVVFSFYDDRLFRVVVDYGREQTQGMTPADLIAAVSEVYGAATARPANVRVASRVEAMSGTRLARW